MKGMIKMINITIIHNNIDIIMIWGHKVLT